MAIDNDKISITWSKLAIFIALIVSVYISFDISYWRGDRMIIRSDVVSYYSYLPSTFIYSDLSLDFTKKTPEEVKIWFRHAPNKGKVIKTTMGVALCYLPFFSIANNYAHHSDKYKPNGFSLPYRLAIAIAALFYLFCALFFVRKYLLKYFSEIVVFWSILAISIGTNVLNYVTVEPGMSHIYSLALISICIYLYDCWLQGYKRKYLYGVSILIGLICLIRPTNGIVVFFLFLYKINSFDDLRARFCLVMSKKKQFLIAVLLAFLVILPQLLYWKYNTGDWVYFSYVDNERFYFNDPKIIQGLFSYRKGWLLYTPIMGLSILGLLVPYQKLKGVRVSLILAFALQIYIVFSWWSWYYGGSFGLRAMIDFYPIAIISFAGFLAFVFKKHFILKGVLSIIIIALIYINIFQSYQYRVGLIHYSAMTKETYWGVFLKHKRPKGWWDKLKEPNPEAEKMGNRDL